jgi:hypothetical protein
MTSTEENANKMLFDWTMEELLKLIEANNTIYKEDSFYLGGSRLYIPPQDWHTVIEDLANPDRRWRSKFLYNMSKLGEKDKCEEEKEEDQDDFTDRICENHKCKKEFDLTEPHYYDEEDDVCYCCKECFEEEKEYIGEAGCLNYLFGIPLSKGIIVG